MTPLVGADPELFAFRDGKHISGYGLIPGTKKNPHRVSHGAVQVDGMALEFNIDPASSEDEFVFNIDTVMAQLREMAGVDVVADPVAHFDPEYLKTQPDEALDLGCDPDFNAWSGLRNPQPDVTAPFRTGSGHVHIGWMEPSPVDDYHVEDCRAFVRQLDYRLGLPSLVFDPDVQRRALYGRAGAFRAKPYGVEYRVLSNRWLASQELQRWVYRATLRTFEDLVECRTFDLDIQTIINESKVEEAVRLCEELDIEIPEVAHVGKC